MDYIIVQAGGKGTRLKHLTQNKSKALIPIENLPMIFHLFRKFPDKKFIIIADYKREVLREYLAAFAEVKYLIVEAEGTGTCAGIKQAIARVPDEKSFMLIWSDLILSKNFELPSCIPPEGYIGISKTFPCRWSFYQGRFLEKSSCEHGVAGFFLFSNKKKIESIPKSGELIRWMQEQEMEFQELSLAGTREFGLIEEYEKLKTDKCRPFNQITIDGNIVVKEPVDAQGKQLSIWECAWYGKAQQMNIGIIPAIYSTQPLKMELIHGKNIYECPMPYEEKKQILKKLVEALHKLHQSEQVSSDFFSIKEAYYNKTIKRLLKVEDLIPFSRQRTIRINGKDCRNVFFYKRELEKRLEALTCEVFHFIHGDCTFSNLMLRDDGSPVLIDPRGYFGFTELYGDIRYDWAKLYYSIIGNYDQFNLKNFQLEIHEKEVLLNIASNHWEDMEGEFFALTQAKPEEIKLLHAVIWLSLTTYAWQDYDSICGAFYNGLYYLEDLL